MTHVKDALARFFESLSGLAALQDMNKAGKHSNEYSPQVELIMELSDIVKDWDISTEDLYGKRGRSAQLWSDLKTGNSMVVFFRSIDGKGVLPMYYLPVASGQDLVTVLNEGLNRLATLVSGPTLAA